MARSVPSSQQTSLAIRAKAVKELCRFLVPLHFLHRGIYHQRTVESANTVV